MKYRFYLQEGEHGGKHRVYPIFKDDLSLDYEQESGEMFYRAKLSGKLNFVRDDYEWVLSKDFDTMFILTLYTVDRATKAEALIHTAKFHMTDCTVNVDDKRVSVQPDVYDEYDKVLNGMDKEFNLVELAPHIESVGIDKRPLIQFYVLGDSSLTCFLSGMRWEQDATEVNDLNEAINKYHFAFNSVLREMHITGVGGINGLYVGESTVKDNGEIKWDGDFYDPQNNNFYVQFESHLVSGLTVNFFIHIIRRSDGVKLYSYQTPLSGIEDNKDYTLELVQGATGYPRYAYLSLKTYYVVSRYLCDVATFGGVPTYEIPSDDISGNNRNYKRAIGYKISKAVITNKYSKTPTVYGKTDSGEYFRPPVDIEGEYFPIGQTQWRYASIWFSFPSIDETVEQSGRKEYTLKTTYPLASCISVLLGKIAPNVKHEANANYSEFLYSASNPISGDSWRINLVPKTNVTAGELADPAQKATVTLKTLTDMLKNCFRCYWFIDEQNRFRIEQYSYFANGGSYSENANVISTDLTRLENIRNGKKWGFSTSTYSFDKEEMPERYTFEWMDEVTEYFKGYAIEMISSYVSEGKKEEINISSITTDIDYILLNPDKISKDGFAMLAVKNGKVLYDSFYKDGNRHNLQNGTFAMVNLQPQFWVYGLPASRIRINGDDVATVDISRKKKQTVTFPMGEESQNVNALIRTYLGDGKIEKLSLNLLTRAAKTTLKYETE